MQSGLLLALVPLVCWGLGDYMAAKLGDSLNPYEVNFTFLVYGIPGLLGIMAFKGIPSFSLNTLLWYFLASALLNVGFLCMVKGFSSGAIGIVAAIANSYAVVTMLVTAALFHTHISSLQIVSVISIVIGIALVSYHKSQTNTAHTLRALKYALTALTVWGLAFTILGQVSKNNDWYVNQFVLNLTAGTLGLLLYLGNRRVVKQPATLKKMLGNWQGFVGGTAGMVGAIVLFAAFSISGNPVLVAAIASAAPLMTGLLAYKFDNEKLSMQQRIGVVFIVGAVVAVNLLS